MEHMCEHAGWTHACVCVLEGSHPVADYYTRYPHASQHGIVMVFRAPGEAEWATYDTANPLEIQRYMVHP